MYLLKIKIKKGLDYKGLELRGPVKVRQCHAKKPHTGGLQKKMRVRRTRESEASSTARIFHLVLAPSFYSPQASSRIGIHSRCT